MEKNRTQQSDSTVTCHRQSSRRQQEEHKAVGRYTHEQHQKIKGAHRRFKTDFSKQLRQGRKAITFPFRLTARVLDLNFQCRCVCVH
jgi:hypothetical protein